MSGSGEIQSVDEVLMQVVGMGFSLEDAQQALQAGKLQPAAIIDWILAGKPQLNTSSRQPALRLRPAASAGSSNIESGPLSFSQPPLPIQDYMKTASAAGQDTDPTQQNSQESLVSRTHLNDEQRKVKDSFEEKQRLESQRLAKQERIDQKKAKDQILQQIKEDREMAKLKKAAPSAAESGEKVGGATPQHKHPELPKVQSSMLQIRLADGRALRETFPASALLRDVWNVIQQRAATAATNTDIIQPFPRRVFTDADMESTLSALGLVPNGSLVLKKRESNQTSPPSASAGEAAASEKEEGGDVMEVEQQAAAPSHGWGVGHPLLPPVAGEEEEAMDEEEDDIAAPHGGGGIPHQGAGAGAGADNYMWGFGNALVGEVYDAQNMAHHRQEARQLAVDAARDRFIHAPPLPPPPQQHTNSSNITAQTVPSLVQIVLGDVCHRICDSRHPITGLHRLPLILADKILQYLIHEKLLKPKTLHPFVSCRLREMLLDCYPYTTNELLVAIRLHPNIVHLSLRSCPLITDKGLQPLAALKKLQRLCLASCPQITDNSIPLIKGFSCLSSLSLEGCGVTDVGIQHLFNSEGNRPNIQCLDLNRTSVSHAILPCLANSTIRVLNLEGCQNVSSLSGIEALQQLVSLNVAGTNVSTDSMMCLNERIAPPKLTALNIANIDTMDGDTALKHITGLQLHALRLPNRLSTTDTGIQYLAGMPLTVLDLTNYINVGDAAMEAVGTIHSLERLRLSNTKVGDAGMLFLEGLTNLTELVLDRTRITNQGASIMKAFTHLHELSLAETGISNAFLRSRCLEQCCMLSKLNLARTSITDKGMCFLRQRYLSLINIDGTRVENYSSVEKLLPTCPALQNIIYMQLKPPPRADEEEEDEMED